jgi:hypothetical protein
VEADAALCRAARHVVLDAVAGEDLDVTVVHCDGEVDGPLALRDTQDGARLRRQVDVIGRAVELGQGRLDRVRRRPSGSAWRIGDGHGKDAP